MSKNIELEEGVIAAKIVTFLVIVVTIVVYWFIHDPLASSTHSWSEDKNPQKTEQSAQEKKTPSYKSSVSSDDYNSEEGEEDESEDDGYYDEPSATDDDDYHYNASAICMDGTYSYSQSRRGTCSYHGGVSEWLY